MLDLEAIKRRFEAATPGPWVCENGDDECCSSISGVVAEHVLLDFGSAERWKQQPHRGDFRAEMPWIAVDPGCERVRVDDSNFEFIAHAREDVPLLVAELESLRAELARLRETVTTIRTKLEDIVDTSDIDGGVILLSSDSTFHTEERGGKPCQVYDHEYFSPLGDALIEVWQLTKGASE